MLTDGVIAIYHGNNSEADASGNGHTLTRTGATYDAVTKKLGSHAFSFDGVDDRLVQADAAFKFEHNQPFSVGFWNYQTGYLSCAHIGNLNPAQSYRGWEIYQNSGKLLFQMLNWSSPVRAIRRDVTSLLSLSVFQCVICTYDGLGLAAGLKIYIDDMVTPKAANTVQDNLAGGTTVSSVDMFIGTRSNLTLDYAGKMDEIVFWGRELPQADREAYYNGGAGMELVMPSVGRGMRSFDRGIYSGRP